MLQNPGNEMTIYSYIIKGVLVNVVHLGMLASLAFSSSRFHKLFTNISAITLYHYIYMKSTPDRRQSKISILPTNVDKKTLETEFSKTLFLEIFVLFIDC